MQVETRAILISAIASSSEPCKTNKRGTIPAQEKDSSIPELKTKIIPLQTKKTRNNLLEAKTMICVSTTINVLHYHILQHGFGLQNPPSNLQQRRWGSHASRLLLKGGRSSPFSSIFFRDHSPKTTHTEHFPFEIMKRVTTPLPISCLTT